MAKPQVGDKVLVIGHETWGPAIVRFLGETEFRAGIWAGVEYPTGVGNTNGTVNGIRYFKCPRRHGLFVTPNLIAPAPMRGDDDTIDATTVEGIEKLGRQLSDAAFIGNVDDVVRLLDQGAPIDWPDRANHDRTPLHYACSRGNDQAIATLLHRKADIKARDASTGRSALHFACTFGQLGAIRLLLEARADLHSRSTTNETPLHYAAMQDQLAAARLLLDSRATVDAVSSTNSTALHTAASKGYADLVTLLLDYGADQSIRDNSGTGFFGYGNTAADIAKTPALRELMLKFVPPSPDPVGLIIERADKLEPFAKVPLGISPRRSVGELKAALNRITGFEIDRMQLSLNSEVFDDDRRPLFTYGLYKEGATVVLKLGSSVAQLQLELAAIRKDYEARLEAANRRADRVFAESAVKTELKDARARAVDAEARAEHDRQALVRLQHSLQQMSDQVREQRFMSVFCKSLKSFRIERVLGSGQLGLAAEVKCLARDHAWPERSYAMKICFNYDLNTMQARGAFINEFIELVRLPGHHNIVRFLCEFFDEITNDIRGYLPEFARQESQVVQRDGSMRNRKTQFFVLELLGTTLDAFLKSRYAPPARVPLPLVATVMTQIGAALQHLEQHLVAHRDIKPDNILVELSDGDPPDIERCVLADFGTACRLNARHCAVVGVTDTGNILSPMWGNQAHIAPELHTTLGVAIARQQEAQVELDYSHQSVFELAVLGYEIVTGDGPIHNYPASVTDRDTGVVSYTDADIIKITGKRLPQPQATMLYRAVSCDPTKRPSLSEFIRCFTLEPQVQVFE